MQTVNPLGLDLHDATHYAARHEVRDMAHRDEIVTSMTAHGWVGAPLVADVETAQAITGSHRLAAARIAGIDVPAVDIADLAAACGIDLWEFVADYADLEDALPHLCAALPAEVTEAYGLDID